MAPDTASIANQPPSKRRNEWQLFAAILAVIALVSSCSKSLSHDYDKYLIELCLYQASTAASLSIAEKFYTEAVSLQSENDYSDRRAEALSGLATCLYEQQRQTEARAICVQALHCLEGLRSLDYLRMRNLLLMCKLTPSADESSKYLNESLALQLQPGSGVFHSRQFHHERARALLLRAESSTVSQNVANNLAQAAEEAAIGSPDQQLNDTIVRHFLKLPEPVRKKNPLKFLAESLNYHVLAERLQERKSFEQKWSSAIDESDKTPDINKAMQKLLYAQQIAESFGDAGRIAMSLSKRAYLLMTSGRSAEAKSLYENALDINTKIYGPLNAFTAIDYTNMGDVCSRLGQYSEALGYYLRAHEIYNKEPRVAEVNKKYIRAAIVRQLKKLRRERESIEFSETEGK